MKWISTKDKLPKEGKYVLAKHNKKTWHDDTDQNNVNCVIVKLVKGISIEERTKMENGELPETSENGWCLSEGWKETKRSKIYREEDEHDNNLLPYNWKTFGASSFFGQEITHWMSIPKLI